jgi:hypothetical protein|nr:hypothetical protein [uncultured Schaedlerella sp.]
MMTPDVNVVVMDFKGVKGNEVVTVNEDNSYTILINARLSYEGQLKAYQHALRHIENNDFQKNDVQSIEYNAHQLNTEKVIPVPAQKYLERIRELQKERRRIQRQIKKDQERVKFIMDNSDLYKLAEHQYLYGDEL